MRTPALLSALVLVTGALLLTPAQAQAQARAQTQTQTQAPTQTQTQAPAPVTVAKISHATATSMFRQAGITWSSSGNCADRSNPTCTSFDQLNLATAQAAQVLKGASGCALNITGGTETGHANGTYSHWNGYKIDVAKATCVGNYIKNTFTYIGLRGDGAPQWRSGSGNVYTDEGSHWDVLYYNCGGC
ncbi:hypothetical protein [Streptomyces sp. G-G2]|uniref:hypothetical protein n=1 Tax=Streptomyces sp. G-G2 TaxID=3046201 RepID=UPI0024B995A0|nr:hypothetical protein [Streptomyces sp. G-G2]MDJ0385162.1 hypothetical protein [Streptomyces sp. G-G2]